MDPSPSHNDPPSPAHRRRPRYPGKYPRRFEEKYKELAPERFPETVEKVVASGKTPAGTHRPIMVDEVLAVLELAPGNRVLDVTLGYGGHAQRFLERILPGGRLLGLDQDPLELPRTEARLRGLGYGPDVFLALRTNFAGLGQALTQTGWAGADVIFADLGLSSMQIDNPERGFSWKFDGPLDMRMNPGKGETASALVARLSPEDLANVLRENADEALAEPIAASLAGRVFHTTRRLADAVRRAIPHRHSVDPEAVLRRVFQALRIAVNHELSALDQFLREIPYCLAPGGRVGVLTFHSGEDRRVKQAFLSGRREAVYDAIADEVLRPSAEEVRANPRSAPAKLRWARRSNPI